MADIEIDGLIANYDELRQSRGWTWEQMAEHIGTADPLLAAKLREHAGPSRTSAPANREAKSTETTEVKPPAKVPAKKAPAKAAKPKLTK